MTPKDIYVHLPHGLDPEAWAGRYERGTAYDASPYGFHRARSGGRRVVLSKDRPGSRTSVLQYVLMRLCCSIDVVHAYRNRQAMGDADAVWTILDSEGLAVALLMKLGLVDRKPLVGNLVWAFDKWRRFSPLKRAAYRWLTGEFSALTVHSDGCLPVAARVLPGRRAERMYFGINVDAYRSTSPDPGASDAPIRILGIGNDPSRDWTTFLAAYAGDPRFAVDLVCRHIRDAEVASYGNVRLIRHPKMQGFRDLYAAADFVVVPMRDNVFSGITVALEAVASGKPVISSRTGGVPTYFAEDEVVYVPVSDPTAMRDAALGHGPSERAAYALRARRRFLADDYSADGMMARYAQLTDRVASESTIEPRRSCTGDIART